MLIGSWLGEEIPPFRWRLICVDIDRFAWRIFIDGSGVAHCRKKELTEDDETVQLVGVAVEE